MTVLFTVIKTKLHILQVIGQWITNPKSCGNVLALQGPMGNGKTTLLKEGIAKAIGRPFAFIALVEHLIHHSLMVIVIPMKDTLGKNCRYFNFQ